MVAGINDNFVGIDKFFIFGTVDAGKAGRVGACAGLHESVVCPVVLTFDRRANAGVAGTVDRVNP